MTVKVLIFSIWRKFTHKTICLGYIDFVEFMVIFHVMSDGTSEEVKSKNGKKFKFLKLMLKVLAKIFRLFDVNSDGHISNREMKRLVKESTR